MPQRGAAYRCMPLRPLRAQDRCKVLIAPVVRDTGSGNGPQHPRRCKQRIAACALAAALAPSLNQPWLRSPGAGAAAGRQPRPVDPRSRPMQNLHGFPATAPTATPGAAQQGRFQVPVALRQSCTDLGTTSVLRHPRRCQERVDPCASAAALAPSLNQPWLRPPDAGAAAGRQPRPADPRSRPMQNLHSFPATAPTAAPGAAQGRSGSSCAVA